MSDKTEEYQCAVIMCANAGQMLGMFDLPGILKAINHAESIAPLVDPTLWIQKNKDMAIDKKLLEAALPLWKHVKKMEEEAAAEKMRTEA